MVERQLFTVRYAWHNQPNPSEVKVMAQTPKDALNRIKHDLLTQERYYAQAEGSPARHLRYIEAEVG